MKKNRVAVLMSTYNGEKYLETQIESVMKQKKIDVYLFIRDDGSKDNTINILKKYESNDKVNIFYGDNIGYANSFWNLLTKVDGFDYYAFCDQDDIWLDNKLYAGILKLKDFDGPALYTSKVISINNDLNIISDNTFNNHGKLNVFESFQKSVFPGCVFIFNEDAQIILKKYNGFMESHDWAAYTIISVLGNIVYDDSSYIYYRIHNDNTIGKNNKFKETVNKVERFLKKSKCTRSHFAKDFYNTYNSQIPVKHLKEIHALAFYKESLIDKLILFKSKKFKGIIFKLYVLLEKV